MSNVAIRIENLAKSYRIGRAQTANGDHSLRRMVTDPFRYLASTLRKPEEDEIIWALKDVSFEVNVGEVIGLVGRNGAGKSTLLKVLSRITEPTRGQAEIHGRVGSLLEVGTGFHPELTGRENIYLNGTILGMRRTEIDRKFDEIVAFAETEKFLDTPVKRYSSGMYVRLAFAVAAHLEPEILVVDEVLAVGDASFQKKCLGKMEDVAQQGRTVLFVSHNMVAVQSLCSRAVWLEDGVVRDEGATGEVLHSYLSTSFAARAEQIWDDPATAPGNDIVRIHRMAVFPSEGRPGNPITTETPVTVEVEFWNQIPGMLISPTLHIFTEQQILAFSTGAMETDEAARTPMPQGLVRSRVQIPAHFLNRGLHKIVLLMMRPEARPREKVALRLDDSFSFEVLDVEKRQGPWFFKEPGVVRPRLEWQTEILS